MTEGRSPFRDGRPSRPHPHRPAGKERPQGRDEGDGLLHHEMMMGGRHDDEGRPAPRLLAQMRKAVALREKRVRAVYESERAARGHQQVAAEMNFEILALRGIELPGP